MVEYMDKCVGRVVKQVDDLGLGEDTLVIFYSDNGTHRKITSQTKNGPVVGGKGRTTDAARTFPWWSAGPERSNPVSTTTSWTQPIFCRRSWKQSSNRFPKRSIWTVSASTPNCLANRIEFARGCSVTTIRVQDGIKINLGRSGSHANQEIQALRRRQALRRTERQA